QGGIGLLQAAGEVAKLLELGLGLEPVLQHRALGPALADPFLIGAGGDDVGGDLLVAVVFCGGWLGGGGRSNHPTFRGRQERGPTGPGHGRSSFLFALWREAPVAEEGVLRPWFG